MEIKFKYDIDSDKLYMLADAYVALRAKKKLELLNLTSLLPKYDTTRLDNEIEWITSEISKIYNKLTQLSVINEDLNICNDKEHLIKEIYNLNKKYLGVISIKASKEIHEEYNRLYGKEVL